MRRLAVVLVPLLLALAIGAVYLGRDRGPAWTTASPQAAAEFENCLDARRKFYFRDAVEHCGKAVELDPGFAVARLGLAMNYRRMGDDAGYKREISAVRQAALAELTPRERFFVRYTLARNDDEHEEADRILAEYLSERPEDPFALNAKCERAWSRQEWAEAEPCYKRLLEVEPDWVEAQNLLGYIAMAQGQFAEAEDRFKTYRYIAPDQANPHDSLGELLTLIGRYEEAERELEEALRIRRDFCHSYDHLVHVHLLAGDYGKAESVVDRVETEGSCDARYVGRLRCVIPLWREAFRRDWEAAWRAATGSGCMEEGDDVHIIAFSAAVNTGRWEEAERLKERLRKQLEEMGHGPLGREIAGAILEHLEAAEHAAAGSLEEASDAFRKAGEKLRYWNDAGLGIFKLVNQMLHAEALARLGRAEDARAVLAEIRAVNPRFAADYVEPLLIVQPPR